MGYVATIQVFWVSYWGRGSAYTGRLATQCKAHKNDAPIAWPEAVNPAGGIPVLVTKGDRRLDVVCLNLADFLAILADVGIVYDGCEKG